MVALGLRGKALLMLLLEPLIRVAVVAAQETMQVEAVTAAQAALALSYSNTQ